MNDELLEKLPEEEWNALIFSIVKKFIPLCKRDVLIDVEDLKQEAWIALLKACENYDPNKAKNIKFSSFAWIYINGHLCRFVTNRLNNKPGIEDVELVPVSDNGKIEQEIISDDLIQTIFDVLSDQEHVSHLYDHFILKKSFREIAEEQNVSHNLIHLRIKKMVEILGIRLKNENAPTY
jgi:RNA polymerase sigma factor (sigma-70 family)